MSVGFLPGARMLVFDFDGTLVDSNRIKQRAFETCFAGPEFRDRRAEILSYCAGNHHAPRGEKFRHVVERILGRPYTPEAERRLHDSFERETTEEIIRAPEIPGASEFLAQARLSHRTAVLSSTPHPILLAILERRGWSGRFDRIQGAPVDKTEWLRQLHTKGFSMDQILFFGDSPEDAQAAEKAGCRFLRVPDFREFLSCPQ